MHVDRPLLGILLMLGFCVMAPMADALAKLLGERLPMALLLLARFGLQAAILAPLVILTRRVWRMRGRVLHLAWLRAVLHIAGIGMMFAALRVLPLADAIAIAFVMPFIMLLLGHTVLGEEVGWRRLAACAVGFIGTLMVIRPSFQEVGWAALLPLGVAVAFALFILVTRQIVREVDPVALQAVNGGMASALLLPVIVLAGPVVPDLGLARPDGSEWAMLCLVGVLGTVGHLLMTWSLRFAPAATLAPMQYLEIPVATLIGWAVFADLPDGMVAAGIAVTVAAGLYIVFRERAIAAPRPQAP
ncbi:MAG: DMT family transporter [Paracoccaceae bacterium]